LKRSLGLALQARTLPNVPEVAKPFEPKKFLSIIDFLSNGNNQKQKKAAALFKLLKHLHKPN